MVDIIGLGTESDPMALRLDTRKRNHINNVPRLQHPPDLMRTLVSAVKVQYPNVELISASSVYNCYGLVFASRRTCVVDEADVPLILHDDDFHTLPWDPVTWRKGDVVLYRNASDPEIRHVALIAELRPNIKEEKFEIWVISAWGDLGEYFHKIDEVPELWGAASEVKSQRVLL